MRFVTLTLKGTVNVYRVKDVYQQSLDSVALEWTASLTDVLKQRNSSQLIGAENGDF